MTDRHETTIGCIERVSFPELGVIEVDAKIDTGAYSGALHCTEIKVMRKKQSGKRVLKFIAAGNEDVVHELHDFHETYVRSATGHRQKRYVVDTVIEINDEEYPIRIGLSDRSKLRLPVLIGRRFLRDNNIIVDVRINQELDDEGENTR